MDLTFDDSRGKPPAPAQALRALDWAELRARLGAAYGLRRALAGSHPRNLGQASFSPHAARVLAGEHGQPRVNSVSSAAGKAGGATTPVAVAPTDAPPSLAGRAARPNSAGPEAGPED